MSATTRIFMGPPGEPGTNNIAALRKVGKATLSVNLNTELKEESVSASATPRSAAVAAAG